MGEKIAMTWHIHIPNWSMEFGQLASPAQRIPNSKHRLEGHNLRSFLSQPAYPGLIINNHWNRSSFFIRNLKNPSFSISCVHVEV